MTNRTLHAWIDHDNCLSLHVKYNAEDKSSYYLQGPIIRTILDAIDAVRPDTVIFSSFSNRQSFAMENENSDRHNNLPSVLVIHFLAVTIKKLVPIFCKYKPKIVLDKFLLVDTFHTGQHFVWDEITTYLTDSSDGFPQLDPKAQTFKAKYPTFTPCIHQNTHKLDLFYMKAHRAACCEPEETEHFVLAVDDRDDILTAINEEYNTKNNRNYLPQNMCFKLFQYIPAQDEPKLGNCLTTHSIFRGSGNRSAKANNFSFHLTSKHPLGEIMVPRKSEYADVDEDLMNELFRFHRDAVNLGDKEIPFFFKANISDMSAVFDIPISYLIAEDNLIAPKLRGYLK